MRQQHHLPKTMNYVTMNIDEIMNVTARLNTILLEETQLLSRMQVRDLKPLQAEKDKLSQQLTSFQKQLANDNAVVKNAPEARREELLMLTDDLTYNIEENMRRTVIAKTVNQRVMQTLTEVMADRQRPALYGRQGQSNPGAEITISVNINEKA